MGLVMDATNRQLARRLADRIACLRRGHAWETIDVKLGEVSLLRTDCTRCGQVGPLHGTPTSVVARDDDRCVGVSHADTEPDSQPTRQGISAMHHQASVGTATPSHVADRIDGFGVEARDGSIGKVHEGTYEVGSSYIVVDTGPWIFGKRVLLPASVVEQIDSNEEAVYVALTTDEIKDSPEFDPLTYRDKSYRNSVSDSMRHRTRTTPRRDETARVAFADKS